MKLLLAEDTRDLNRALTVILEHEGYEVDPVFDGEAALGKLLGSPYDAAVLDIMMPKMDGIEVLREIRKVHILTPVLLLTARAEIDDRVAGLDAGADDYLTKPFAMKELLARVRALTRRKSSYGTKELAFADVRLDADTFELSAENSVRLSLKEFELMQALILNENRELSTEYLLSTIWEQEEAHPDTVWLYISYLRDKLASISSCIRIEGERGGSFRLTTE